MCVSLFIWSTLLLEMEAKRAELLRATLSGECRGGVVKAFVFENLGKGYSPGFIFEFEEEGCKFFCEALTSKNIELFNKIEELSSRVNTPFLLEPMITARSNCGKKIISGYAFDKFFIEYIEENEVVHVIDKANGLLHWWWSRQISNMLDTIEDMHKKKVFHGNLDNDKSYVMVDSMIHMIKPTIDGRKEKSYEPDNWKRNDLEGFSKFLLRHAKPTHPSEDWDMFYDLFSFAEVARIKKHPYLKDEQERFDYLGALLDCCLDRWDIGYAKWFQNRGFRPYIYRKLSVDFKQRGVWDKRIVPNSWYDNFYRSNTGYSAHNSLDLLRYVRNILKHFRKKHPFKTVPEIERDLNEMFPGLVSHIHNYCVYFDWINDAHAFKITEE